MTVDFSTTCYAKCILAGEHSVIVGNQAVIVPITSHFLTLTYTDSKAPLSCTIDDNKGLYKNFDISPILEKLIPDPAILSGHFEMKLEIPLSAGLGGSATISVALARWLAWREIISAENTLQYAHSLENFFHGTSSGADVAAVYHQKPIIYQRGQEVTPLDLTWQPNLYLSYCGQASKTSDTVKKVMTLRQQDTMRARATDQLMSQAVTNIIHSLTTKDDVEKLADGINQGYQCFDQWGLISPDLQTHCQTLFSLGASAVKPTGAGMGGYVLSLWPAEAPQHLDIDLLPVFGSN